MDLLQAGCQGLGLALAAGALLGAPALRDAAGSVLLAAVAVAGAALFGLSLTPEDHPAWPGWLIGAPAAALAYVTSRDLAAGARARGGGSSAGGIAAYLAVFAALLAALALLGSAAFVSIVALLGIIWLFATRRRKAGEKYEGLRSLR